MDMNRTEALPAECRGIDLGQTAERLPGYLGEMFLEEAQRRLGDLGAAMDANDAKAVMDAAHSLASITGLLPIHALHAYARDIYAAGEGNDLASARYAHERVNIILGWVLWRLRTRRAAPGAA